MIRLTTSILTYVIVGAYYTAEMSLYFTVFLGSFSSHIAA